MSSEAALLQEISRLSGAINRHKNQPQQQPGRPSTRYPANGYNNRYTAPQQSNQEVVINGVAFESRGKSLVRKSIVKPAPTTSQSSKPVSTTSQASLSSVTPGPSSAAPSTTVTNAPQQLVRIKNGLVAAHMYRKPPPKPVQPPTKNFHAARPMVPLPSRVRRHPIKRSRNLTLTSAKKIKKSDKQCKHFTMTGMCKHGLTCPFQHDPNKVSLCPLFLKQTCPHLSDPSSCPLSHEPTPERTPICTRFNSTGDCYKGSSCLYPHIRVGVKTGGVCRDFAVLGYCEKGAECESDHLKECPDFAATGKCDKMGLKGSAGCKLPHVIRANKKKVAIVKTHANPAAELPAELSASAKVVGGDVPMVSGHKRKVSGDVGEAVVAPEMTVVASKKPKMEDEVPLSPNAVHQLPMEGFDGSEEFISLMFEEESDDDEGGEEGSDEGGEEGDHDEMGTPEEDDEAADIDMDDHRPESDGDDVAF